MTSIVNQVETIRRQVSSDPGNVALQREATALIEQFSAHLHRALTWLRGGFLHEANVYSEDCGNLARCLVDVLEDADFCQLVAATQSLPTRAHIEPLVMAPVDAGRDEALVDAWIHSNVTQAPIEDRLACLQALRHAQPRETRWTDLAAPLVDIAIAQVQDELEAIEASGDDDALQAMLKRLAEMGIASSSTGARAVNRLERAWASRQDALTAKTAAVTALSMHNAWAAMDVSKAASLRTKWASIVEAGEVAPSTRSMAKGVEQWLDGLAGRVTQRAHESRLVDELERGLDEERSLPDLERQYAALQRQEVGVPQRVTTRLSLRLTENRAARRRRWAVAMAVVAGLAAILIVAILVTGEARRREFRASLVEQTVARQLDADDPNGAIQTLEDALDAGNIDADMGRAIHARIDQKRVSWVERFNASMAHHDRAVALLLEADSETMFVEAEESLKLATATLPRGEDLDMSETQEELRTRRLAWTRALRAELLPRLTALDSVIAGKAPDQNDAPAWATREQALAQALSTLESISSEPIAAESDLQNQLQRRRLLLTKLHDAALHQQRVLHNLKDLLLALQRMPATESSWATIWETLLADHASELTAMLPLKDWNDGLHDAQAGVAVQHWRDHVYPELLRAGIIGNGPPAADQGVAADRLRTHVELPQHSTSPYRAVAKALLQRADGDAVADAVLAALASAQLEDLYRVPLSSGGVLYRRSNLNLDQPLAHALLSTDDLGMSTTDLLPAELPDGAAPQGSVTPVTASALLTDAIEAMQNGADIQATLLTLLEQLEQEPDPDGIVNPLVRFATLKAIAQATGPQSSSPLTQWITSASRAESPLRSNWPRESLRGTRQSRRELIRSMRRAIIDAPSPASLQAAMAAPALDLLVQSSPAAPAAILLYRKGQWAVLGTLPQRAFLLQSAPGRASAFVPLTVDAEGTVHPPSNCLALPTLIFEQK